MAISGLRVSGLEDPPVLVLTGAEMGRQTRNVIGP